jgi:hypothetical protein
MQDKQKVTLYLPPKLHRQLKIRSAVDMESMSTLVEKAIVFYLDHPEVVDEVEASHGKTHRVYSCPTCNTSVVLEEEKMVALESEVGVLADELPVEKVREEAHTSSQGEEQLVPC